MKRRPAVLVTEEELLSDLTLHSVSVSLLSEFARKIVRPYYQGNMNAAVQDLLNNALIEQNLLLSHITHVRGREL